MSKLLINEPPLQVLPSLAVKIGLNEAIIVQQIHYWLQKNKPMEDGNSWVFNSVREWKEQFPFWSENTILRNLQSLRDSGLLIAEQKSKNSFDKTLYYRINYDLLSDESIHPLWGNRDTQVGVITIKTETTKEYIDRFEIFWKKYPRKVAKPNALKAWLKIKPDDVVLKKMLDAINQQGLFDREIQFVPHPASWLNAQRWEDELKVTSQSSDWWANDKRVK